MTDKDLKKLINTKGMSWLLQETLKYVQEVNTEKEDYLNELEENLDWALRKYQDRYGSNKLENKK